MPTIVAGHPNQTLARKTALSAGSSIANTAGNFVVTVVIARRLGPSGTGEVAYILWLSMTVGLLTSIGLPGAMTRFAAELSGRGDTRLVNALIRWLSRLTALTLLVGLAGICLYGALSHGMLHRPDLWITLSLLFLTQGLGGLYMAHLAGHQRFSEVAWINLVSSLIEVPVVLIGCRYFGVVGGLASYVATMALPALLAVRLLGGGEAAGAVPPDVRARVWRYSLNNWAAAVVSAFVWTRLEIFFLQRSSGSAAVAMFTVGLMLATLVYQIPQYLTGALLPHLSELVGRNDAVAVSSTYASTTRLMGALVFPLSLCTAAAVPLLLPMIYGAQFSAAIPTATVLVALGVLGFASVGSSLTYASEQAVVIAVAGLVGAVISVVGCLLVVPRWGYFGAACLRAGVQTLMVTVGGVYITYWLRCPFPLRGMLRLLAAAIVGAAVMKIGVHLWMVPWTLVPLSALSAAAYFLAIRVLHAVPEEDVALLESVLRRSPAPIRRVVAPFCMWLGGRGAHNVRV